MTYPGRGTSERRKQAPGPLGDWLSCGGPLYKLDLRFYTRKARDVQKATKDNSSGRRDVASDGT